MLFLLCLLCQGGTFLDATGQKCFSTVGSYNLPGAFLCTLCTKGGCSGTRVPTMINKNCFGLLKEFFMLFFVVAIQKRIQIGGAFKPYCRKRFNQRS